MERTLRTFIAIAVSQAVVRHCRDLRRRLVLPGDPIRWVPDANVHLTLKFLGTVAPQQVALICRQMDAVARQHSAFELRTAQAGCFPNPRRARVIWVGLEGQTRKLHALQKELEIGLETIGFAPEKRRFSPHLTLGRCRRNRDTVTLADQLAPLEQIRGPAFAVDRIDLMKSELLPSGARYSRLHTAVLDG